MARKDLSRTVIEGGRAYRNSWERRASHGVERATTRAWLDSVVDDLDNAEASAPPPIKRVYKDFHDKLGPAMRWLRSNVGRPWSKVYSELRTRFDARTVAGRHVVEDHILKSVHQYGLTSFPDHRRYDFYVDEHGILRTPKLFGRNRNTVSEELARWTVGRRCALTYRGWWWFRHHELGGTCADYACPQDHFVSKSWVRHHVDEWTAVAPMTRGEIRRLCALEEWLRKSIVIASPWPAR